MNKKYYFPNDEEIDGVFGAEIPRCLDWPEVKRLCEEWGLYADGGRIEIYNRFHVATPVEIEEYGYYDSETKNAVRGNYERDCENCAHSGDCRDEWFLSRERDYCCHHEYQN